MYGVNAVNTDLIQNDTTRSIEHKDAETTEKSGETSCSEGEALEQTAIDIAKVQTFFGSPFRS